MSLFRPITKYAAEVTTGHGIPEAVATAFRVAEGGRPGAAFVALPKDVMEGPAPTPEHRRAAQPRPGCLEAPRLPRRRRSSNRARMPVLFLGMLASLSKVAPRPSVASCASAAAGGLHLPGRGGRAQGSASAVSLAESACPITSPATDCSTPRMW